MTQSKDNKVTVTDYVNGDDITINLNDTYGTTTSYCTVDDTMIYSGGADTISTIDISNIIDYDTITVGDEFTINTNWSPTEFVDILPPIDKIESMSKQYPALKQAYEKFKYVYNIVKDDWSDPDDELPF